MYMFVYSTCTKHVLTCIYMYMYMHISIFGISDKTISVIINVVINDQETTSCILHSYSILSINSLLILNILHLYFSN